MKVSINVLIIGLLAVFALNAFITHTLFNDYKLQNDRKPNLLVVDYADSVTEIPYGALANEVSDAIDNYDAQIDTLVESGFVVLDKRFVISAPEAVSFSLVPFQYTLREEVGAEEEGGGE